LRKVSKVKVYIVCVRDSFLVKVNKKKNVNNNNILKIESEYLRLAILLNNNLEFQYKWNLIYKYILIFIKFSTFIIFVVIKCTLFLF